MKESREWLLANLHYVYPVVIFLYFAVASAVAACTLQTSSPVIKTKHGRPKTIIGLLLLLTLSYFGQLTAKIVEYMILQLWPKPDVIVGLLSCILVFGIEQTSLGDASTTVWYPFYGSWLIALAFDPVILVLAILASPGTQPEAANAFLWVDCGIIVARCVILLTTILAYFIWRDRTQLPGNDSERSPLIPKPDQRPNNGDASTDSGYGTNSESNTEATNSPSDAESPWERQEREGREQMEKRLKSEGSWIAYAKGFMVFFPYVWPVKNRRLQIQAALVAVCLIIGNALNVLIPRQMGIVLDTLNKPAGRNPWVEVMILAGLKLASSEAGINFVRQLLWIPVEYHSSESLAIAAYSHVMNLSSEFHDNMSSSDLIVAISNVQSVSSMLESVCFQALPMLIDLVVAFIYLSATFGPYEGFITVATGMAFIHVATWMIARVKDKRKTMVKTFFEEHYRRQAGIQGWLTVSAFNQIPYEEERYEVAAKAKNSSMKNLYYGYLAGHAFQYLILLCGLIAGAFLAVYQVIQQERTAGDFAMLLAYWGQLTSPLRFFASLGKSISQELVYAERLLDVMLTKPTVVDKPNAKPLELKGGRVEFRNVNFSYDKKQDILKGVKLSVPVGKTVAFVGATGAGKSTILKLLDRFYDVKGGSIQIDGQDIRDVQLSSLRQSIGIVPQSPILFDDTIMNNIRYARLTASDEEIYAACKAAAIHEHIMGFSEGYKTRVGERGVKVSGGELQRIAIARAILKRPDIVLLDEATSSVDTETEQKIQDGLRILCEGRTTFIVAHRLSTVMNADIIFVVSGGEVVEQGSHEDLLKKKGKYSELWSKQIFVKPKESQQDQEVEQAPQTESQQQQSEGTNEGQPANLPSTASTTNGNRRQNSTPKLDTNMASKANDEAVKTPSGHTKEVDQSKDRS
ncbi:uncharacterized protein BCR38DRAFT_238250 [Pseudomassariella vexata]|uniref:Heavy metal tolerance protein n=1 Tax=Pseudomassariella vexata TaxID=1141098 RepID=A0A1Y2DSV2_9PEZI|nr:uncharacterized protein BCR38DRAFT_238250 [Pseudomassariella vexata]ORY62351.1 hypothetical protein BCR38DRAFT_238250 [Pseudomassariella vexata]